MVITNLSGEKIIYPEQKIVPADGFQRFKKAGTTFLKTISVTILMSFIPVLHFVLVPVGALITLYSTWAAWKMSFVYDNFDLHCPTCDQKFTMAVSGSQLPLRSFCSHCRNMIYVNN